MKKIFITTVAFIFFTGCQMQNNQSIQEGNVKTDSSEIYYKIIGEGESIVVVHGGPGFDHIHMLPLAELADEYQMIFYDQRATGNSTASVDEKSITVDNFVEDLEALRKHLNIEKLNLIGHSWGAGLSTFYAIKYPDKLNSLILLAGSGPSTKYFKKYMENMQQRLTDEDKRTLGRIEQTPEYENRDLETIRRYFRIAVKPLFYDPEDVEKLDLSFGERTAQNQSAVGSLLMQNLGNFDISDQLAKIHCPTLIVRGDADPMPLAASQELHQLIGHSRLIILENTGHFLIDESPDQLFPLLRRFLKNIINPSEE